jgi:hypothetical protein
MKSDVPHYHGHRRRLREHFLKNGFAGMAEHEVVELLLTLAISRKDVKKTGQGFTCTLPDTLPLEELSTGRSEIRNHVLAPIFKDLKLIEAWGTGIQKMPNEVSKYPEIELVLHEVGHAFQVQFREKEVGTKKGPSTEQVPNKPSY